MLHLDKMLFTTDIMFHFMISGLGVTRITELEYVRRGLVPTPPINATLELFFSNHYSKTDNSQLDLAIKAILLYSIACTPIKTSSLNAWVGKQRKGTTYYYLTYQ
jgi:hypothetical protein